MSEYQLLLFDFTSCAREVGVARVVESAASRTGRARNAMQAVDGKGMAVAVARVLRIVRGKAL